MILTLLTTFLIINAIVLFFLILVLQHGNEGGFGGSLGGGNSTNMFGASGGVKFITRATWISGVIFFVLALSTSWFRTHERYAMKNAIEKSLAAPAPLAEPVKPESNIQKPASSTHEKTSKPQ